MLTVPGLYIKHMNLGKCTCCNSFYLIANSYASLAAEVPPSNQQPPESGPGSPGGHPGLNAGVPAFVPGLNPNAAVWVPGI